MVNLTQFSHASTTVCMKVNHIVALEIDDAIRVTDYTCMCHLARKYFEDLLHGKDNIFNPVISVLTSDDSWWEWQYGTYGIFAMHPNKFLWPESSSPGFYQEFWNTCNPDIFQECCRWLNENQFPLRRIQPTLNLFRKDNNIRQQWNIRDQLRCVMCYIS